MYWFTRDWWKYLLEKRGDEDTSWFTVILCRIKGHPAGPVWNNAGGYEPDMSCRNCGDDLG